MWEIVLVGGAIAGAGAFVVAMLRSYSGGFKRLYATWRALYLGLEKLEAELMEHIHLENNILFPRALAM